MTIIKFYIALGVAFSALYIFRELTEQRRNVTFLNLFAGVFFGFFWPLLLLLALYCWFEDLYFKFKERK